MTIRQRRTPPPGMGDALRDARHQAGLTLKQVADQVLITDSYLSHLESGERCPSRTIAGRLVKALALDGDDRALVESGAVDDAGLDHPWRRSFSPKSPLWGVRKSLP